MCPFFYARHAGCGVLPVRKRRKQNRFNGNACMEKRERKVAKKSRTFKGHLFLFGILQIVLGRERRMRCGGWNSNNKETDPKIIFEVGFFYQSLFANFPTGSYSAAGASAASGAAASAPSSAAAASAAASAAAFAASAAFSARF